MSNCQTCIHRSLQFILSHEYIYRIKDLQEIVNQIHDCHDLKQKLKTKLDSNAYTCCASHQIKSLFFVFPLKLYCRCVHLQTGLPVFSEEIFSRSVDKSQA